uniref:RepP3 n=1 Tax=Borrelia parkeri TaxID=141 RepID=Q9RG75_BORPR|nr:RepP3- [Borrelia parkeri]
MRFIKFTIKLHPINFHIFSNKRNLISNVINLGIKFIEFSIYLSIKFIEFSIYLSIKIILNSINLIIQIFNIRF